MGGAQLVTRRWSAGPDTTSALAVAGTNRLARSVDDRTVERVELAFVLVCLATALIGIRIGLRWGLFAAFLATLRAIGGA